MEMVLNVLEVLGNFEGINREWEMENLKSRGAVITLVERRERTKFYKFFCRQFLWR
jgi:hypothetical protein